MARMNDAVRLRRMEKAARFLLDSIMRDPGGFSLETLHRMVTLGKLTGHPDHLPVTAVEGEWSVEGSGDEPRFFGAGALTDVESN